jgi:hypothetical protein
MGLGYSYIEKLKKFDKKYSDLKKNIPETVGDSSRITSQANKAKCDERDINGCFMASKVILWNEAGYYANDRVLESYVMYNRDIVCYIPLFPSVTFAITD